MLGKRIVELRLDKGLKQIELAEELGIANTTLSQYESEQRRPSDEVKIRMANYFNVTLGYLMGHEGEEDMKDERIFSTIPDPIQRAVKESIERNAKNRLREICNRNVETEEEILLSMKYKQERLANLNREIKAGLAAIKEKVEVKAELKELMAKYQKEY